MSQNVVINKNKTKGDTIAADYVSGIKHQQVKIEYGNTGQAIQVSDSTPLPVKLAANSTPADATVDAFGRLRVSNPTTLFDSKQIYDGQLFLWSQKTIGNATITHNSHLAASVLACSTSSGDKAIRQSKIYIPYQPGKSFSIKLTGILGSLKSNVRQRIGYFDDNNGLFFEQDGTNLKVVVRSSTSGSPVNISVNQANWNIDPMNGTGSSGITLDMSKVHIFTIDFQWLGVGRVRFGFNIDGKNYYVHEFTHANINTSVYMSTPTLPVRYELENTNTTASSTSMQAICASVVSEGGYTFNGLRRSIDRGITTSSIGTTLTPLISLKLSSSYIRSTLSDFSFDIFNSGNAIFRYGLYLNPTITGGTAVSWNTIANSYAEYDIARTGAVSGGLLIHSGYAQGSANTAIKQDIDTMSIIAADVDGISDQLVLAIQTVSGSNSFYGSLSWKEYN
jgi:hypothetical protein